MTGREYADDFYKIIKFDTMSASLLRPVLSSAYEAGKNDFKKELLSMIKQKPFIDVLEIMDWLEEDHD